MLIDPLLVVSDQVKFLGICEGALDRPRNLLAEAGAPPRGKSIPWDEGPRFWRGIATLGVSILFQANASAARAIVVRVQRHAQDGRGFRRSEEP